MVDAADLKSAGRQSVWVRVPPALLTLNLPLLGHFLFVRTMYERGRHVNKEDRQMWRNVLQATRPFPISTSANKLLVGVSGGADSLALLHLLWQQLGPERLLVAHLNHQLRPEADEEANFVAETAAS